MNTTGHFRQVRDYYERNTDRFLRWGKDEGTFNLHGALWAPGVASLSEAMNHANELVAREIEQCPYEVHRVLDLGCGVGASIFYLARRLPSIRRFSGISLSPVQIARARRLVPESQKSRFHFKTGNFLQVPAERFRADFSYSIEAFAHGPDPAAFFSSQADVLPSGGRLVIIDDCLGAGFRESMASVRQHRLLADYRRNWLLPGLRTPADLQSIAEAQGFRLIKDHHLTPFLRLRRPRDRMISLLVGCLGPLMERHPYLRSLRGGDAKQKCYLEGLIQYRLLVFENVTPLTSHV